MTYLIDVVYDQENSKITGINCINFVAYKAQSQTQLWDMLNKIKINIYLIILNKTALKKSSSL